MYVCSYIQYDYLYFYLQEAVTAGNMLTRRSATQVASEGNKRKTCKYYKTHKSLHCREAQHLSQTGVSSSDGGIGHVPCTPHFVDASTNTESEDGTNTSNAASQFVQNSPTSSQEEEVGESNEANPPDDEQQNNLDSQAGGLHLLHRRAQGWLDRFGAVQPTFLPDRQVLHYTAMVIRVAEVLQSYSVAEIIHHLTSIRCHDGSPFLAGSMLIAPDNQIYKIFTALEQMNILTTRDGHFMEAILNAMHKPSAMHHVAKFHSMANTPPPLQQVPELTCSDRFLFSVCDCLGSLPSMFFEEIVRVKMILCQYLQFEKYTTQFRGWKQLEAPNECAIFFQAPYAYFDQLFVMFFHETGPLFQQNVVSLDVYLDSRLSLQMTPQEAFCLLHSLSLSGCPGGVLVSRSHRPVSCVVEITGEATSYFVWVSACLEKKDATWRSDQDIVQSLHAHLVGSEKMCASEDLKCVALTRKEQCVSGLRTFVPWEIRQCLLQEIHSAVLQDEKATSDCLSDSFKITFCGDEGNPQYITAKCTVPKLYCRGEDCSKADKKCNAVFPDIFTTDSCIKEGAKQRSAPTDTSLVQDIPVQAKRFRLADNQV